MERQGNLYDSFGEQLARQQALFDNTGPELVDLTCEECGERMERTPTGYLTCPKGHGRLREDDEDAERREAIHESWETMGWFDKDE